MLSFMLSRLRHPDDSFPLLTNPQGLCATIKPHPLPAHPSTAPLSSGREPVNQRSLVGVSSYPHPPFLAASFGSGAIPRHRAHTDRAGSTAGLTHNPKPTPRTPQTKPSVSPPLWQDVKLHCNTVLAEGFTSVKKQHQPSASTAMVTPAGRGCVPHQRKPAVKGPAPTAGRLHN